MVKLPVTVRVSRRVPLLQVVKTSIAAVLAWFGALWLLPGELPIFATIAALLVVQPSVNQSLGKALERSVGVIAGVLIALGAALLFGQSGWLVLLAVVVSVFVAWAARLSPGSANQLPISAMLVLAIGSATPQYATARIVETLIGAAIGVAINAAIVPPLLTAPAHLAVSRLAAAIAEELDRLADTVRTPQTPEQLGEVLRRARELRQLRSAAIDAVDSGRESLTLNPRRSRHREVLEADIALMARIDPLVTRVIGMARALRDHYSPALAAEPTVTAIGVELSRAAHDLRLLLRAAPGLPADDSPASPDVVPALTSPLVILAPHPEHWILIGALMEDLRRVREEIVGAD